MRLALISLLMIPLASGCALSCEERCEEAFEDCIDENTPSAVCDSKKSKCKRKCLEDEQASTDESESDCESEGSATLQEAISSGRISVWIFLGLGFIRRISLWR